MCIICNQGFFDSTILKQKFCTKNKQHLIQEQHYFFLLIASIVMKKKNVSVKWLHIKAAGDNYL